VIELPQHGVWAAEIEFGAFSLKMTSSGSNFNYFVENQLTKFSARDAGDFSDA